MSIENITPEVLTGTVVCKHNDLIEAKYQVQNLQEQRLIMMLLSQIKKDDEDFKCYRISVADFAEILGLRTDGVYDKLETTLKTLMSRVIHIKNGKSFLMTNWLSSAKYIHGSGYVELAFDPNLKPYLLQLKSHFTQYKLDTVLHFKSIYSIRLYELLKKEAYKAKNGQYSVFFEYEDLREQFGIGKKEYSLFANFKMKAIQPTISEISNKTDLIINDVKYGKTGRKITNITFEIGIRSENETKLRQANLRIEDIKPETEHHPIIETLVEMGFSLETAKACKNKHGVKKIERNIAYTLAKKQAGKVKDIPAYLHMAFENDYGGGAWEQEQKKKEKAKQEKTKQENEQRTKQHQEDQHKTEQLQLSKQLFEHFLSLPEAEQNALRDKFLQEADSLTLSRANASMQLGEPFHTSPIARENFKIFLKAHGALLSQ